MLELMSLTLEGATKPLSQNHTTGDIMPVVSWSEGTNHQAHPLVTPAPHTQDTSIISQQLLICSSLLSVQLSLP